MQSPSILSSVNKLRDLLTRKEKWQWGWIIAFALCTSVMELITASTIVVLAQVINQPDIGLKYLSLVNLNWDLKPDQIIMYVAIVSGLVYVLKNLVATAEVFYQNFTIQRMNYQFKGKLLQRYAQADYSYYLTQNSSYGVAVMSYDAELVFSYGMFSIASIVSESVVLACLIGMVIVMNPSLALIIFVIGASVVLVIIRWLMPQFYRWGKKLQEAGLLGAQNLLQFFHAFKEIILLDKRHAFIEAYQRYSRQRTKVQAIQNATSAVPRMIIEVLFVGLFVMAILYMCLEHQTSKEMMALLGGYLYTGFRVMPGLNRIINQMNNFKSAIPSIDRVHQEYHSVAAKESCLDIPNFRFSECLTITAASFRYRNANKDALKDVNLTINKGERIGIIGETGSGKSTLVDMILGLLKPYSGAITVDNGFPVCCYQWRRIIGYVPQSIYLVDDTIEANVVFGDNPNDIDQRQLNRAIDDAQLRRFINQLPEGMKTIVGERGIRLSGGERQRIAIARALYRNPEVLVFDEATSALDNDTEAKIIETIDLVSQTRTVIMIAHRLTTLKDCDRIIVLKDGKIDAIKSYRQIYEMGRQQYA
jgi:ATP-binding cassette, subfamily B, bacterial PglK